MGVSFLHRPSVDVPIGTNDEDQNQNGDIDFDANDDDGDGDYTPTNNDGNEDNDDDNMLAVADDDSMPVADDDSIPVANANNKRKRSVKFAGATTSKKRTPKSKKATKKSTSKSSSGGNKDIMHNYDVVNVKTAKNCAQRWNTLFAARDSRKDLIKPSDITQSNNNEIADPFDCSDLIVPPSHELVNCEVAMGLERWRDLASRVVVEEDELDITTGTTNEKNRVGAPRLCDHELLIDGVHGGDRRKQRLLPYNFDYACKTEPSCENTSTKNTDASHQFPESFRYWTLHKLWITKRSHGTCSNRRKLRTSWRDCMLLAM